MAAQKIGKMRLQTKVRGRTVTLRDRRTVRLVRRLNGKGV